MGVIANYVASPLYLLSVFIPSGSPWLQVFMAATVVLRIGIAGMSFAGLVLFLALHFVSRRKPRNGTVCERSEADTYMMKSFVLMKKLKKLFQKREQKKKTYKGKLHR